MESGTLKEKFEELHSIDGACKEMKAHYNLVYNEDSLNGMEIKSMMYTIEKFLQDCKSVFVEQKLKIKDALPSGIYLRNCLEPFEFDLIFSDLNDDEWNTGEGVEIIFKFGEYSNPVIYSNKGVSVKDLLKYNSLLEDLMKVIKDNFDPKIIELYNNVIQFCFIGKELSNAEETIIDENVNKIIERDYLKVGFTFKINEDKVRIEKVCGKTIKCKRSSGIAYQMTKKRVIPLIYRENKKAINNQMILERV